MMRFAHDYYCFRVLLLHLICSHRGRRLSLSGFGRTSGFGGRLSGRRDINRRSEASAFRGPLFRC
jgi:hypothetical protein